MLAGANRPDALMSLCMSSCGRGALAVGGRLKLGAGAHIAVVGGGPAGSGFALFALHYARRAGIPLYVTVFEPRDFTLPGPWGCNMCAGLIPLRSLAPLHDIGLTLPEHVIRNHIERYTLYTVAGCINLPQPDPDGGVISVYRGNGPRHAPWPFPVGLDAFLLDAAVEAGAEVRRERVLSISLQGKPTLETSKGTVSADLVVLATGVNAHPIPIRGISYRPPPRRQMAQTEFYLGEDEVRQRLGESVHIFLPRVPGLIFGTLVPKGPCVNVSLMGKTLPRGALQRFLDLDDVARLLPPGLPRACGCRPHIAVGPARPLFADRFVAVGDAGITRLYKNGIGTALRMARHAAYTAICEGVSREAFLSHYGPYCRDLWWDNLAGRMLFQFTYLFQFAGWFAQPHLLAIEAEQAMPPEKRRHSRILWGMFTGTESYRTLLGMALHPLVHARIFRAFVRGR